MPYFQIINEYLSLMNPALILILLGLFMHRLPIIIFKIFALIFPIFVGFSYLQLNKYDAEIFAHLGNYTLNNLYFHKYSLLIAEIFCISLFLVSLYSFSFKKFYIKDISCGFIYAGAAIATITVGDFISFYIYWEIMTLAAVFLILNKYYKNSYKPALRYMILHFAAGVILLCGIVIYIDQTNSFAIANFEIDTNIIKGIFDFNLSKYDCAALLILIGIIVNVAVPPFSAWVADSYPATSPTASIYLSIFTTKTAIFALLTMFSNSDILIYLGLITAIYGLIYAILENNIRKLLCYLLINQLGFMMCAIGTDNNTALDGVAINIMNHVFYKSLLFMIFGMIIYKTNIEKITQLHNLRKKFKISFILLLIACASMVAMPFSNGFISKTIIMNAIYEYDINLWFYLLAISSAIMIPIVIILKSWFKTEELSEIKISKSKSGIYSYIAMIIMAMLCVLPAMIPGIFTNLIDDVDIYSLYNYKNITKQTQIILASLLASIIMISRIKTADKTNLEIDWFYRVFIYKILEMIFIFLNFFINIFNEFKNNIDEYFTRILSSNLSQNSKLTYTRNSFNTLLFLLILLAIFLIFSLVHYFKLTKFI